MSGHSSSQHRQTLDPGADRMAFQRTGLKKFFEAAIRYGASDMILRGGQAPKLRLRGTLKSLDTGPIDEAEFDKRAELVRSVGYEEPPRPSRLAPDIPTPKYALAYPRLPLRE